MRDESLGEKLSTRVRDPKRKVREEDEDEPLVEVKGVFSVEKKIEVSFSVSKRHAAPTMGGG